MYKILRIANRFNLGGPTFNVGYLTKYLEPDFQTMLVGGEKDDSEDSSTFILDQLGLEPIIIPEMKREINLSQDRKAYKKIKEIILDFKPDIVHTHASKAGAIGRLAAYNCQVPLIFHTFHGHVFHSYFGKAKTTFYKSVERYLAKKSTKIIAISNKQKRELVFDHQIAPENKVAIVPLGFDLKRFQDNMTIKRAQFRNVYQVKEDEIAIGIVGRLVPIKNHSLFLKAIKHVAQHSNKKIRGFVIGDGESRDEILEQCKQLNIQYQQGSQPALINFTSWIRDVDVAYAGLDIVALTSLNEGTPVSLIEAQAASKPIVSTEVGGVEDIVLNQKTGFLSPIRNEGQFFQHLLKLVNDRDLRERMSKSSAEWVNSQYNYTVLVNNMRQLYLSELHKLRKA